MKQFLRELAFGEQQPEQPYSLRRVHANEDGNISMSALFVMLAFFVLIGFLGNAGQAVFRKLETQNAADSMAHSSTVWMARHMNAITATNHLMGEVTSIVVLIEALGGPELDGTEKLVEESEKINEKINKYKAKEVAIAERNIVGTYAHTIDVELVEFLQEMTTSDDGKHDACATIYDGFITMKLWVDYGLFGKDLVNKLLQSVADILSFYPPAKYIVDGIVVVAHIAVDLALVEIVKDWYLTKGVELLASGLRPLREPVLPLVISGLSMYGDYVASPIHLRTNLERTLEKSRGQFRLTGYETFPLLRDVTLPIRREDPPQGYDGGDEPPSPPSLSPSKPKESGAIAAITKPLRDIQKAIKPIIDALDRIQKALPFTDIPGLSFNLPPDVEFQSIKIENGAGFGRRANPSLDGLRTYAKDWKLDWEKERDTQWMHATYPHVDQLRRPITDFFHRFIPTSSMDSFYVHWSNRYAISVSHRLRKGDSGAGAQNEDADQERLLAKVRKKLEDLRTEFNTFLDGTNDEFSEANDTLQQLRKLSDGLKELRELVLDSGASDQLSSAIPIDEWLTLAFQHADKAEQIGRESQPEEGADVEAEDFKLIVQSIAWINYVGYLLDALDTLLSRVEDLLAFGPPHMHIMKDSTPETKGSEPWTRNANAAEALFTIQVFVKRETPAAILTPPLYPNPNSKGVLALAESMLYNGNGRKSASGGNAGSLVQPDTGWDLLNWTPPVRAPKWGAKEAGRAGAGQFPMLFADGVAGDDKDPNRIQINWQSKLVPIGPQRLRTAFESPTVKRFFESSGSSSLLSQPDMILH